VNQVSEIYLTLSQLNQLFQALTVSMLGITADNPYYFVRIAWPQTGAPAWKITEDVCFLRIIEKEDPYNKQRDAQYDGTTLHTSYTRVLQVTWTFYGPNSFENAQVVRDQLFYSEGHNTLVKNNIYLIPNIQAPRRIPEAFNNQWWERTDLTIDFNELVKRELAVPYLRSAGIILTDGTFSETITIPEEE